MEHDQNRTNPWTQMSNSIKNEDLKSFQGLKRFLAKGLLDSGNCKAFHIADEMLRCLVDADYNLPRLKIMVSKTKIENLIPPKPPLGSLNERKKRFNSKQFLLETLVGRLMKSKASSLAEDQVEMCIRKTIFYILRGVEGKVEGQSRLDEWKAVGEPQKAAANRTKNQKRPSVPTSEIVFNYLPPGLREEEGKNKTMTNDLSDAKTQPVDIPQLESKEDELPNDNLNIHSKYKFVY